MSRLAALLFLALALFQGSGLESRLGEVTCADQHHGQGESGSDCAAECAACRCCTRATFPPMATACLVLMPLDRPVEFSDHGTERLPAPPPRGILHVPRLKA